MQRVSERVIARARELMREGTVNKVAGWKAGEFFYDCAPYVFESEEALKDLVYDRFCAANLSKYMIKNSVAAGAEGGKVLVLLKPCDTYSFNQLLTEHRIARENVYVLGVGCEGMCDIDRIREKGFKGITGVDENADGKTLTVHTLYGDGEVAIDDVLVNKCEFCKGKAHMIFDELISDNEDEGPRGDRFAGVRELEALTPAERFAFWQAELSKCIRCNACRNACPACSCRKCVFDNDASGIASKANTDSFEEKMFLRREDVPHHPRVPRCGALHGLRRMHARVSAGHTAPPVQPQIHQRHQRVLRRIRRRSRSGAARTADQLYAGRY